MRWKKKPSEVSLDEIFLDAVNVSAFNQERLEGRLELPIAKRNVYVIGFIFTLVALWFFSKLFTLQITEGADFRAQSENNRIDEDVIIASRGVIYDRNDEMLAWNEEGYIEGESFPFRAYTDRLGLGQVVGYISYPQKDSKGFYFRTEYVGRNGVEASYNATLAGSNGRRLVEVDAVGERISEHAVLAPSSGDPVHLSIDAGLSEAMYEIIATSTTQAGIRSGAAAIMDVHTGEIIALTSFPSYDPEVMADGDDIELIASYNNDERFPFMNKVFGGVYTPGSIMKPFVAYGALAEDIISPNKIIVSNGEIVIPNPYTPSQPSIFRDWRAHGPMDMREAIAFSSNVYFYVVGGGFGDQEGLGITRMSKYFSLFGFGQPTGIRLANEQSGTLPTPAWKEEVFDDDWRLGDTYFTAIGQYGWQISPLQALRAYAALANGGKLLTPHIQKGEQAEFIDLNLDQAALDIVREGMNMTTYYPGGTARSLEKKYVNIAAKSGTAELDFAKARLNTWAAGYWPYEEPKYAFIILMENAPYANRLGGTTVMGTIMDWIHENRPEYLGVEVEVTE